MPSLIIVDTNGREFFDDSFDRFGDDLNELILSYLSLEDKIRLQCVAKQWRRTIFIRQKCLEIDEYNHYNSVPLLNRIGIDAQRLKSLLNNCPNIRSIKIGSDIQIDDSSLKAITKLCPRLETITFGRLRVSVTAMVRFGQQLGQRIKSIKFSGKSKSKSETVAQWFLLYLCPNIESLQCHNKLSDLIPQMEPFAKLKTFVNSGELDGDILLHMNELMPNLRSLTLYRGAELALNKIGGPLTKLEHLVVFRWSVTDSLLAEISVKFPNLKRIEVNASQRRPHWVKVLESLIPGLSITSFPVISDYGVCQLIDSCKRLKTIEFSFPIEITSKSIDKLVDRALKTPNDKFRITFFSSFCPKPRVRKPNNLSIDIKAID